MDQVVSGSFSERFQSSAAFVAIVYQYILMNFLFNISSATGLPCIKIFQATITFFCCWTTVYQDGLTNIDFFLLLNYRESRCFKEL